MCQGYRTLQGSFHHCGYAKPAKPTEVWQSLSRISALIDSGISTKIIKLILPCRGQERAILPEEIQPGLLAMLGEERDWMTERIEFLTRNRDSIAQYMDAASETVLPRQATTTA